MALEETAMAQSVGKGLPLNNGDGESISRYYSPPTPRAARAEGDQRCLESDTSSKSPTISPDHILEGGRDILDQLQVSLSEDIGEAFLVVQRKKGPSSLLGTGSSVASASDHSEFSDFESDSGVETSRVTAASPEVGLPSIHAGLFPKQRKKKKLKGQGLGDESAGGSGLSEQSSEVRIDSFISCLDDKVTRDMLTDEAVQLLQLIPEGYIPLPHQIGGHRHVHGKLGFLRRLGEDNILLKPVPHPNGPREIVFYKKVFKTRFNGSNEDYKILKELIPQYYGTQDLLDRAGHCHKYLKLEDIASRFHKPCIMDLKIGRRVWDDFAQQEVIDRKKRKYPQQEIIGFRIVGMRIYRESSGDYMYYDKEYGRNVDVHGVLESLGKFFSAGDVSREDVIGPIIVRLSYILRKMELQKLYRFFATSILIVYEGDTKQTIRKPEDLLDVRLVDFAHAFERDPQDFNEPDFNTIFGISSLIKHLEQLRNVVR